MAFESMFHALFGKSIYCCFAEEVFGTAFISRLDRVQAVMDGVDSLVVDTIVQSWKNKFKTTDLLCLCLARADASNLERERLMTRKQGPLIS